ncbi:hypothetical protein M8R19_26225 [Pseudomonas sp. R3.Fl]|uniref:hypothetical protein n=1 Tax=Pseudomonas TaxID=286 RepID=UPI0011C0FB94|nr:MULTISPECIES: hypothetical protein [Pseudomonas]MCL6692193.1 hypothetical protein [Pseudomonas sp. R3.Fl]MDN6875809.1 hypothetical protein [Pseudomonas citronellolis]
MFLKVFWYLLNSISGMFFMGDMLLQTEKARQFMQEVDRGYFSMISIARRSQVSVVLVWVAKVFGGLAFFSFLMILIAGWFRWRLDGIGFALVTTFLGAVLLTGSLFWVLRHRIIIREFLGIAGFFGGSCLMLPMGDMLLNINVTQGIASLIARDYGYLWGGAIPVGLLQSALVLGSIFIISLACLYLFAWVYAAPVALFAISIVAMPILWARLNLRLFPKRPIVLLFLVVFLISTAALVFFNWD